MTRILCITSLYPPHHLGGYEVSCADVMNRLAVRGHDVTVLTGDHRNRGVDDRAGERAANPAVRRDLRLYINFDVDLHELHDPPFRDRWRIERQNQEALAAALDQARPDVVAVWHVGALSLGLVASLVRRGIPIVYGVSDDWPSYAPELDQWAKRFRKLGRFARVLEPVFRVPTRVPDLGQTGSFLFISDCTWRRAEQYAPWTFPDSSVVYSGIDRTLFAPSPDDVHRAASSWSWRLLYVGRFDARKGIETVLRALPLLPPEATLEVQGTGDDAERARLASIAETLGVADRVRWERVTRDRLVERYRAADVLVFPSEWEEPFGLVPLEAMAVGTPVVGTGVGGSGEFLLDERNCLRFAAGDAADLAAALQRLAGQPLLRQQLVTAGVRTAEWFDVDRLTDSYEQWYRAAAAGFAHGRPERRHFTDVDAGADERRARVRVGIVSWNTADLLDRCLRAVPAALAGTDAEVVVVDNASSDDSAAVAGTHAVTLIRNARNVGYAKAMNQALAGGDTDVLIALNPDTEPPPRSLADLVRRLEAQPEIGLVVPRLANLDGSLQHSVYRFPSPRVAAVVSFVPPRWQKGSLGERWWLEGAAPHDRSGPIDWAIGAVHAIRSEALDGELPYSERWFMYVEDIELCWRMHQKGWQVWFDADVTIPHVSNASGAQAWGSTRSQRYYAATYDWAATAYGRRRSRVWAAVNVVGVSLHVVLNRVGAVAPGASGRRRRATAAGLWSVLPVHARAAAFGPPPPEPAPDEVVAPRL